MEKCFEVKVQIRTISNGNYDFSYLCDTAESAKIAFDMSKERGADLVKKLNYGIAFEEDKDNHYELNDGMNYVKVDVEEKKIYSQADLKSAINPQDDTITLCGRSDWRIAQERYDITDLDWWFAGEFTEGILHINNAIGIMLLIQKDGTEFECYI